MPVVPAGGSTETATLSDVTTPSWIHKRGGDVRAYDRRSEREVYGPSHPFYRPSDILVTNGLLRFLVAPAGVTPYVQVQAFKASAWHDVGCLAFEGDDPLVQARLSAVTNESATVVLSNQRSGDVAVNLKRGERQLRCILGSTRAPSVVTRRIARWYGSPPPTRADAATNPAGKFGNGIAIASGDVTHMWPRISKDAWTLAGWWLPTAASTSQGDSGLLTIWGSAGPSSFLEFQDSSNKLRWTQNGQVVESAALTFTASAPVFFALRHSSTTGRTLSVSIGGVTNHVTNATYTGPGGSEAYYRYLSVGVTSTVWFGAGTFGQYAFGAGTQANGVLDNFQIYDARLEDAHIANLAAASVGLGGLPDPEARMVWYSPWDSKPVPLGSAFSGGRRYEATAQNGATRAPDANGFTKGLAVLRGSAAGGDGLSVVTTDDTFEVSAFLATTAVNDDLADQHAQYGADTTQTIRVRA